MKKLKIRSWHVGLITVVLLLLPLTTYAAVEFDPADPLGVDSASSKVGGNFYTGDVRDFLPVAINWLLAIAAVLALLALVIGGIQYIISFGDEQKASRAKKIIFYALVGLILIGASFAILGAVYTFLTQPAQGTPQ